MAQQKAEKLECQRGRHQIAPEIASGSLPARSANKAEPATGSAAMGTEHVHLESDSPSRWMAAIATK
jgi:hypothetical protein